MPTPLPPDGRPITIVENVFSPQPAPTGDGYLTGSYRGVRTAILVTGTVTSVTIASWVRVAGTWFMRGTRTVSPIDQPAIDDWLIYPNEEVTWTVWAISPGTAGNAVTVIAHGLQLGDERTHQPVEALPNTLVLDNLSASGLNADLVPPIDVTPYRSWSLQVTGTFTATITVQGSNDGVNWKSLSGWIPNAASGTAITPTIGASNALVFGIVSTRYLRAQLTSYTSGTVQGTLVLSSLPPAFPSVQTRSSIDVFDTIPNAQTAVRQNTDITLLSSAARTATTASADVNSVNLRGITVVLNVTAASGTGGLTLKIQGKDPLSGNYVDLLSATTPVTAVGTYTYVVYPGASLAGGVIQVSSLPLPRIFRVQVVHGDGSSYTYSVGASLTN